MTPQRDESLRDRLEKTPPKELQGGVKTVEKLDEDDYNAAERASAHTLSKNWNKVKSFAHWFLFACGAILITAFVAALVILLYKYISDVITNTADTKNLLANIWQTVLTAAATLFIDQKYGKK